MRRLLTLTVIAACLQIVPPHDAKSASWGPRVAPSGQPGVATLTRVEQMIAMRDGVRLYTQIYTPRPRQGSGDAGSVADLPIVFQRTPYGVGQNTAEGVAAALADLPADGFIIVLQDIRGRFKSEGEFVMLRQPRPSMNSGRPELVEGRDRTDPKAIDESTDTYDTIEWLLENLTNHNGRVGMVGTSYPAWLAVMGALDPHPALKAIVPMASPADMWIGDDFHHNGAFRLSYGLEYAYMMESSKEITPPATLIDRYDTYDWYLELGSLANANRRYFRESLPTWNDFVRHPDYDAFWKRQAFAPWLDRVNVPTLNVAGWWDQEDFYGPIKIYELLEKHDTRRENFLVVGPWNHGGWSRGAGRTLGRIDFGSDTAAHYRRNIMATFLAHYLKDQGTAPASEALTFRTGANEWTQHEAWPPVTNVTPRRLYFQEGGKLAFTPPPAATAEPFDTYLSDPASPVPYRPRPITLGRGWSTWLVEDQRFVHGRPDVRSYVTDPLTEPVVVSGRIAAHLFAATSGTDSDWIVKLIDVYSEKQSDETMRGFQLMIAGDVTRGRYYKSIERPTALAPNVPVEYVIPFPANDHAFQPGHRIMVQVQSTWFPVIDRNPQTFVPNIFLAQESQFKPATQRIYRAGTRASHIALPVVTK
jgi:putative CocE/NonD family hydrolase